ncbi:MAG: hypothetical protein ACFB51_03930, partial [Anaerolineae bacterium]
MRLARPLVIIFSLTTLTVLLSLGYLVSRPRGPVLVEASFSLDAITPNADGDADLTSIAYRIRREARVSITLRAGDGTEYVFRNREIRPPGDYAVLFSGIVDGYTLPGETVNGTVEARLIPDGTYTWTITAEDIFTGRVDEATGTLSVQAGDSELPDLFEFTVSPSVFTPNQDGIDDRVEINVFVPKAAELSVFLIDEEGDSVFIPAFEGGRTPGEPGRHSFEYDGGIDNGSDPPPDGSYTVQVVAEDAEGQRVTRTAPLTIENGGVPFAEIVGQPTGDTVRFSSETVVLGDVLTFTLTVENYGDSPIRTTGPAPGYVYDQDELYSATGFYEESGVWRVGINCDTCLTDYPWRWALGTPETLTPIPDGEGTVHYYLMPGERAVVEGGIRLL